MHQHEEEVAARLAEQHNEELEQAEARRMAEQGYRNKVSQAGTAFAHTTTCFSECERASACVPWVGAGALPFSLQPLS